MPNYKTHSIHGEIISNDIPCEVKINVEALKSFCMGPDALIITDFKTFEYQHANNVRAFFARMIRIIKEEDLQENPMIMAYLYGQIDHYILDLITHPLIYYMTSDIKTSKMDLHALMENWLDDYIMDKYQKNQLIYYKNVFYDDNQLMNLIDQIYDEVYAIKHEGIKYDIGIFLNAYLYDIFARRNILGIVKPINKIANIGDFTYSKNYDRVLPYLNLEHEIWYNPETGEQMRDSFDDLWNKATELSLETINDVNNFLYKDRPFKNKIILGDLSYNTGLPCGEGQSLKYIKKY